MGLVEQLTAVALQSRGDDDGPRSDGRETER
jgi:hypothetical protein